MVRIDRVNISCDWLVHLWPQNGCKVSVRGIPNRTLHPIIQLSMQKSLDTLFAPLMGRPLSRPCISILRDIYGQVGDPKGTVSELHDPILKLRNGRLLGFSRSTTRPEDKKGAIRRSELDQEDDFRGGRRETENRCANFEALEPIEAATVLKECGLVGGRNNRVIVDQPVVGSNIQGSSSLVVAVVEVVEEIN